MVVREINIHMKGRKSANQVAAHLAQAHISHIALTSKGLGYGHIYYHLTA